MTFYIQKFVLFNAVLAGLKVPSFGFSFHACSFFNFQFWIPSATRGDKHCRPLLVSWLQRLPTLWQDCSSILRRI